MTPQEKLEIFQGLFDQCIVVSNDKGQDYASTSDVLDNFKRNAERLGMTPFQVWAVYFNKHIDSINNAIAARPECPQCVTEPLSSRIVDAVTYLALLQCLLDEHLPKDIEEQRFPTIPRSDI